MKSARIKLHREWSQFTTRVSNQLGWTPFNEASSKIRAPISLLNSRIKEEVQINHLRFKGL